MLRACEPYCKDDLTILLPRQRLCLTLDKNDFQECVDDLICQAENIYELITSSCPGSFGITYHFVRWFCKVIRTEIPSQQMLKVLMRAVKEKY